MIDIIAEIGINHNGDVRLAHNMIDSAYRNGATIVKFQTHMSSAEMMKDIGEHTSIYKSIYEDIRNLELSSNDLACLKKHTRDIGIKFMSTPFSLEAIDELEKLNVDMYKIGSGEFDNFVMLDKISKLNKPLFISTGMSTMDEIHKTVEFLENANVDYTLMQCTSKYPTSVDDINLNMITYFKDHIRCKVGLSDHSTTCLPSMASVSLGVTAIEKHFTISRDLPGPDQIISIEPLELKMLSEGVLLVERAMGKQIKDELVNKEIRKLFRHSIVAAKNIQKGKVINLSDLKTKRPLIGIPASEVFSIIGKKASRDISCDFVINKIDVDNFL